MNKELVVYFSHNKENYFNGEIKYIEQGNTSIVANKIKNILDCDIFEIIPLHDYPINYNECTKQAKQELINNSRPIISNMLPSINEYDTIYLGYPNWWGTMPMIVKTFLESYDFTNINIHPFCTHEGSQMGHSVKDLKEMLNSANICQGLAIRGSNVFNCDDELKKWLGE